ncbi:MAG: hypothetical protein GF329_01065 [Candidatus Lokiarchaeota archaeon]|nr:hypothetical protein [Candidatus Lokiarchaeota archaeon]
MGLWGQIKDYLGETFSIYQFMELLGMDEFYDKREARNVLHQLYLAGKIKRVNNSKNMYEKIE